MQMYKIDLVQIRKMTVYCCVEDKEAAEKWFEENRTDIFEQLDDALDHNVYCFTTYTFSEDNTNDEILEQLDEDGTTN